MKDFKKLRIWKKGHSNTLAIYKITRNFPKEELYGLISQLRRSAASIPANIAEGCGKYTQLDFARYLQNALGSAHETEYHLMLSKDLEYINTDDFDSLNKNINEIKGMLIGLLNKIRN